MGCVRETPEMKEKRKKPSTVCVREPPQIKMKPARDV